MTNPFDDLAEREREQAEQARPAKLEQQAERARRRALAGEYNDFIYGILVQFRDALYPRPAQDETADPVVDDYWISEQPPHWVIYRDTLVRSHGGWQCERSERVYAITLEFDREGTPSHLACGFYSEARLIESTRADLSKDGLIKALRNLYKFRSFWLNARQASR
jgi:hypothetical protein